MQVSLRWRQLSVLHYGPGGRNVIYENYGWPVPTKDGVTVARQIELVDKWENIGAQMVKQVAAKTCDDAGDGTTTATILAHALLSEGLRYASMGMSPIDLQNGLKRVVENAVKYIKDNYTQDVNNDSKRLLQVATVSANWDTEIGKIVSEAVEKVGADGSIIIDDTKTSETSVRYADGIQFDRGFVNPYFINNTEKQIVEYDNPYILLYKGELKSWDKLRNIVKQSMKNDKPLILVADNFAPDVISSLVANKTRNNMKLAAIKAPWFAEMRASTMDDLGVYMDTTYHDPMVVRKQLDELDLDDLGKCKKVIISQTKTTFIGGKGDKEEIDARIKNLKNMVENDPDLDKIDKENINIRIKQLCATVSFISIGANSEVEYMEKKDRYDDAIKATRAALAEGIVPGGSYAYIRYAYSNEFKKLSKEVGKEISTIMKKVLLTPFRVLMHNASEDDKTTTILEKIGKFRKKNYGYNVKTQKFENLLDSGVIDPFKVTRSALENAASVASLMLTCAGVITEHGKDDDVIDVRNAVPSLFS